MKTIIISSSIYLKEIEQDDAKDIFFIINNERDSLREYLPFVDYTSQLSDTEDFILSIKHGGKNGLNTVYVIKYNGQTAGIIGYKDTDLNNSRTEIGYWLSNQHRGKGIVIQACKALIQNAFAKINLNRVQLKIAVNNTRSIAVAKRLGFTLEGCERDGELLVNGFTDLHLYSILKREWNK